MCVLRSRGDIETRLLRKQANKLRTTTSIKLQLQHSNNKLRTTTTIKLQLQHSSSSSSSRKGEEGEHENVKRPRYTHLRRGPVKAELVEQLRRDLRFKAFGSSLRCPVRGAEVGDLQGTVQNRFDVSDRISHVTRYVN